MTEDVDRDGGTRALPAADRNGTRIRTELLTERLAQLEGELAAYKQAKRQADLEIIELRAHLKEAEQLRQSFYYRLGRVAVEFFTTLRGFVFFWPRLFAVLRDELWTGRSQRGKRTAKPRERRPADLAFELDSVKSRIVELGPSGAAAWVRERQLAPRLAGRLLIEIARTVRNTDLALAIELATEVVRLDRSEQRVKWLAMALAEAGLVTEPARLMREVAAAGGHPTGTERRAADEIARLEQVLRHPLALSARRTDRSRSSPVGRILLVAEHALPFKWSVAALRIHALALAIKSTGREVSVALLPSDPAAGRPEDEKKNRQLLDGIWYCWLPDVDQTMPVIEGGAAILERFAAEHAVDLIETELSLVQASVCLEVGRRLDVPVVLDYLGDELFQLPRGIRACDTERASLTRLQQRRLAGEADAWAVWLPMGADAVSRMGPAGLEHYGPVVNRKPELSGDASALVPLRNQARLAGRRVIGFFGEASARYDFELLAMLPAYLSADHPDLPEPALLVAGLGRALEKLQARAVSEGFQDRLRFVRAPSYGETTSILSAMDVFVAPLRDDPAMLVATPFEIVQALASGVPVVAPATAEARSWLEAGLPIEIAPGPTAKDMAGVVAGLLSDPVRLARAAERARSWAERHANPNGLANRLDALYRRFDGIDTERRARG